MNTTETQETAVVTFEGPEGKKFIVSFTGNASERGITVNKVNAEFSHPELETEPVSNYLFMMIATEFADFLETKISS